MKIWGTNRLGRRFLRGNNEKSWVCKAVESNARGPNPGARVRVKGRGRPLKQNWGGRLIFKMNFDRPGVGTDLWKRKK